MEQKKKGPFYGWWISADGFLACFCGVASQQGIPIMLTMIIAAMGANMADAGRRRKLVWGALLSYV
jgi:hypothetical protein